MFNRLAALILAVGLSTSPATGSPDTTFVRVTTQLGDIRLALFDEAAPVTVSNFLDYVGMGHYEGGSFFRTVNEENQPNSPVKIDVIQAGVHPWMENFANEPITLERTSVTGLQHGDGCVSMARGGPDTATSSFFICIGDQPELDFGGKRNPDGQGFAVFGTVVDGMDVVHRIHEAPSKGQAIVPPILILEVDVEP
jgi:peptidyl-prolyl cis-trans isomerase A (cyclophilin A)